MKPLMPLKKRVGGVKGRLDRLAELGPRAGFWFDRLCDHAESVYFWFARLLRKLRPKPLPSTAQRHDESLGASKAMRRCPLRKFGLARWAVSGSVAVFRWLKAHPTARAILVSTAALLLLVTVHSATGHSDGLTMAYVVPIWLATRLGGPGAGMVSVAFAMLAMGHTDGLRGPIGGASQEHTIIMRLSTLSVIMFFIAHIEARLKRAETLASTDALTGLKNRGALVELATAEIERANAEKASVIVAAIDCDRFKLLNDGFGHAFGDMALRTLARKLEAAVGDRGVVARLGGDEFVALFSGVSMDEACRMLDRGAERFLRHMAYFGWERTMTYGTAELHKDGYDFDGLLRKADERLYERKRLSGQIEAAPALKADQVCLQ